MFKLKTEEEYIKRIQELEEELSEKTIRLRKYVIKSILDKKRNAEPK